MPDNIIKRISPFLSLLWGVLLLFLYLLNERFLFVGYGESLFHTGVFILFALYALGSFLLLKEKKLSFNLSSEKFKGIYLYLFLLLIMFTAFVLQSNELERVTQKSFSLAAALPNLLFPQLLVIAFLLGSYHLGMFVRKFLALEFENNWLAEILLGFLVNGILLFLLGAFSLLSTVFISVLLIAELIAGIKWSLPNLKKILFANQKIELNVFAWLAAFISIVVVAFNTLSFTRAIPLGFDELALYMNLPNSLIENSGLINGGAAYYWYLVMSIGYSFNSVACASLLSSVPALLLAFALFSFLKKHSKNDSLAVLGAAAAIVFPAVIWQSSVDAKIDIAFTFVVVTALILLTQSIQSSQEVGKFTLNKILPKDWQRIALFFGLVCGFAFGIKYTGLWLIMIAAAALVYRAELSVLKWGTVLMAFLALLFLTGIYTQTDFILPTRQQDFKAGGGFLILAFILLGLDWFRHKKLPNFKLITISLLVFFVGFSAAFAPWALRNISQNGQLGVNEILFDKGKEKLKLEGIDKTPWFLRNDSTQSRLNVPVKQNTSVGLGTLLYGTAYAQETENATEPADKRELRQSKKEEVERYIGYDKGFTKFITLLLDLSFLKNVNLYVTDIGFLILFFLPLLFVSVTQKWKYGNILIFLTALLSFCFAYFVLIQLTLESSKLDLAAQIELLKTNNTDLPVFVGNIAANMLHGVYAVGKVFKPLYTLALKIPDWLSVLILATLFTLIIIWHAFKKEQLTAHIFGLFTLAFGYLWFQFGMGITWYGLPFLLGMAAIGLLYLHNKEENKFSLSLFHISSIVVVVFLFIQLIYRLNTLVPGYPNNSPVAGMQFNYLTDQLEAENSLAAINSQLARGVDVINANEKSKVLRIGTFTNYFIKNNLNRVVEDNQLDLFESIYNNKDGNLNDVCATLKQNGVNYIIYDLRTASIDNTENKSLISKTEHLANLINRLDLAEVYGTDRIVADPNGKLNYNKNGQAVKASYSLFGQPLSEGSIAFIRLK